ncbi:MAG: ParA family protein [Deltaproteobacteria bacterium]|nr:ParA family protein [Deltaproteobacteria bacterium]
MLDFAKGVIGICQLKGGVGASTMAAALASCWARHGLSVALVDLDDVNPQLSDWARVDTSCRKVTSEFLQMGEVPAQRLTEILFAVEGYNGKLFAVGQPNSYHESFHFKAKVIEGAASASEFIHSLVGQLSAQFDVVVLDLGRSWGLATFAALPLCQHVVLVTDDDPVSVDRSLEVLQRLKRESDEPSEFDFSRWSILLNGYTGRLISPQDIQSEVKRAGFLPANATLFVVPFSERGREWGSPGRSFYDCAEASVQDRLRGIASELMYFRYEPKQRGGAKFLKKWRPDTAARPQ